MVQFLAPETDVMGDRNFMDNISKIVATYVYASSQGQRTHFARTNFLQVNGGSFLALYLCMGKYKRCVDKAVLRVSMLLLWL